MRKFRLYFIIFILMPLAMLSGCLPAFYTYWAPVAKGGRLFYSASPGSIAPSNTIEFSYGNVKIQFSGDGTGVAMNLRLSKGSVVSFLSDEAEFYLPASRKIRVDITATDETTLKQVHFRSVEPLSGKLFVAIIEFGSPEREHYIIKMPPIKVDGQIYNIPDIEFIKKEGFGIFGP